jgi:tRNA threonylcarbamoyladenosine biosynthesis protein TsaE
VPSYTWTTANAAETRAAAAELARRLPRRGVVQLTGNLGAGKTTLVAGLVEALGVAPAAAVTSPTFSLIHEYGEPVRVYHIDLYRLDEEREIFTLGLEEIFEANALVLMEWGEKFSRFMPGDRIVITIEHGSGDERRITATGDRLLIRTSPE